MRILTNSGGFVKSAACFGFALVLCCVQTGVGHASPLAPGGSISAPGETDPAGATVFFTTNATFASTSFSGILTSSVLVGDTSNPYGPGCLTFTYELVLNSLSPDAASAFSVGSFNGFLTDVSYQTPGIGLAPGLISRSPTGSQAVKFDFSSVGYLLPGQNSAILVIQTDATAYDLGTSTVFDNTGSPNVTAVVPGTIHPVPEPAGITFILLGISTLVCSWRIKKGGKL